MAMRRVVVTPTFAAGLGVVVAAALASSMQTVFSYAAPNGPPCNSPSCGVPAQAGGEPAAGDGARLSTPTAMAPAAKGPARPAPPDNGAKPTPAAVPELGFRTSGRGPWGFDATIYITFPRGAAHQVWRLRFGYPSASILKLWVGRFLAHGVHTALVTSADWSGQASSHRTITFSIGVTGQPIAPPRCSFDGRACHISVRYGAQRWDLQWR
jgi:Cellulose binding domain